MCAGLKRLFIALKKRNPIGPCACIAIDVDGIMNLKLAS